MFAFADVFHFFAHEFARLCGRSLSFTFIFARPFYWFFFGHTKIVSPLVIDLDVTKTMAAFQASVCRSLSN
jgi:hypothetical protein